MVGAKPPPKTQGKKSRKTFKGFAVNKFGFNIEGRGKKEFKKIRKSNRRRCEGKSIIRKKMVRTSSQNGCAIKAFSRRQFLGEVGISGVLLEQQKEGTITLQPISKVFQVF